MVTANEFGERLSVLRNKNKITQAELAEKLGVSAQAVSKWEVGGGFPDVQILPLIAHEFDTTTDYLLGCVKKEQKVFCWKVDEAADSGNGRNNKRKYEAELNDKYLLQGWHVVSSHLSSETEFTYIMVIIERDA